MSDVQETIREEPVFEVTRHREDRDVLITFKGRIKLPEMVSATMDDDSLTIIQTGDSVSLRFVGLTGEVLDWLRDAPTVYVERVFRDTVQVSVLQLVWPDKA